MPHGAPPPRINLPEPRTARFPPLASTSSARVDPRSPIVAIMNRIAESAASRSVSLVPKQGVSTELRTALRDLRIELSINTHRSRALPVSTTPIWQYLMSWPEMEPSPLRTSSVGPAFGAATMTGVLVRLEGAGWIIRRPNAIDGRGVRIEASGFERLTDIYRDGNRRLDEIDACLTAEQASIVLDYLQTVTNSVRAASLGLVSRCESDWPVRPAHRMTTATWRHTPVVLRSESLAAVWRLARGPGLIRQSHQTSGRRRLARTRAPMGHSGRYGRLRVSRAKIHGPSYDDPDTQLKPSGCA